MWAGLDASEECNLSAKPRLTKEVVRRLLSLSGVWNLITHQFDKLEVAELVVHWRHPLIMAIVIFVMSNDTCRELAEWCGRMVTDADAAKKSGADYGKLATWVFLFTAADYTSSLLSLVMQQQSILESPHWNEFNCAGIASR